MKTYIAQINFRISPNLGASIAQFDEQLRLIFAQSKQEAFSKACQIGLSEEASVGGTPVRWIFLGVSALEEINVEDGIQINSRTVSDDEPEIYERNVRLRMKEIGSTGVITIA